MSIVLIAMALIFTNCTKDDETPNDENTPDDVSIPLDENSAFNMKNFIISFEQLFVADNRWGWDFSHDYQDGKAMHSYQNIKIYGAIGDHIFTYTHHYNSEGVITSSERAASNNGGDFPVIFNYEYDHEGLIIELTKQVDNQVKDIVRLQYNDSKQLIQKTHVAMEEGEAGRKELFTYHSDGSVATYMDANGNKEEYSYSGGNMIESKYFLNGELDGTDQYEYDAEGRVTKIIFDGESISYSEIEYSADMMTQLEYYDDLLEYKTEYGPQLKLLKTYEYTYEDGEFSYCLANTRDEDGVYLEKYYYEGSPENPELIGYSLIDSRNKDKSNLKTKESIYNAAGRRLYVAEFILSEYSDRAGSWYISGTNWFTADGSSIEESDISEPWVFVLLR